MDNLVIYCCGEGGRVGWISGWDFHQTTGEICDVRLSLNHGSAVIMDARCCAKVDKFLRRSTVFGFPKIFSWGQLYQGLNRTAGHDAVFGACPAVFSNGRGRAKER